MRSVSRVGLLVMIYVLLLLAFGAVGGNTGSELVASALGQSAPLVPLALGAAVVLSVGEVDVSLGGAFSLYGMVLLYTASYGVPRGLAYALLVVLAVAVGCLNGFGVTRLRSPALVFTLATGFVLAGAAIFLDTVLANRAADFMAACGGGGRNQLHCAALAPATRTLPPSYRLSLLGHGNWIAVAVVICAALWRWRTVWAVQHLAVGFDRRAAILAGLPTSRLRALALLASSLLAMLSAVLYMHHHHGGWAPDFGAGKEMVAIAVAVVGGASITGGRFDPFGAAAATLVWGLFDPLQGTSNMNKPELQLVITGFLLLTVVVISGVRHRPNLAGGVQ